MYFGVFSMSSTNRLAIAIIYLTDFLSGSLPDFLCILPGQALQEKILEE